MPGPRMSPSRSLFVFLLLAAVCVSIFAERSPAEPVSPDTRTEEFPFPCGGVLDDEVRKAAMTDGEWRPVPCDPLPLLLHSSVGARDSTYIVELLRVVYPFMERVLGPPVRIETLAVKWNTTGPGLAYASGNMIAMPAIPSSLNYDNDNDGAIDEDPFDGIDNDGDGEIDEDPASSPWWDNVFIHETTHAMQSGLFRSSLTPAWLIEAFAQAAEYFVPREARSAGIQRNMQDSYPGNYVGSLDLIDQAGAQFLGGNNRLYDRFDLFLAYGTAYATILLPAIAEENAGFCETHPIRRLADEIYAIRLGSRTGDLWTAVDRAWNSPIDGVFPPSRWLRARSIACKDVRNGPVLGILPYTSIAGYNPSHLNIRFFNRINKYRFENLSIRNCLAFTDVNGDLFRTTEPEQFPKVPDLPPGAYLVEANETGPDGEDMRAKNWILVTPSNRAPVHHWKGVPVVFVGPDNLPVDPPGLSVNGRIIERVPGGVVVARDCEKTLTFRSDGGCIGTVTIPDSLTRMAVLHLGGDKSEGAAWWTPYRPARGRPMTFNLRKSESIIPPDETDILLCLMVETTETTVYPTLYYFPMTPTDDPDIYTVRFTVPDNAIHGYFTPVTDSINDMYTIYRIKHYADHTTPFDDEPAAKLLSARNEGDRILLTFDGWANRGRFKLRWSAGADGSWTERDDPPVSLDKGSTILAWDLDDETDRPSCYYRVWECAYGDEQLICSIPDGETSTVAGTAFSSVVPNPSRTGFHWRIDTPYSISVRFEVYDITGRLVHGPEDVKVSGGSTEIDWDGRSRGRDLPSGAYLMRLTGPGIEERRKAILIR